MKCQFQKELNEDIKLIKNENRLFVKADKSTNFYKLQATRYILRLVRISLLISAIQRVLRFFSRERYFIKAIENLFLFSCVYIA